MHQLGGTLYMVQLQAAQGFIGGGGGGICPLWNVVAPLPPLRVATIIEEAPSFIPYSRRCRSGGGGGGGGLGGQMTPPSAGKELRH